MRYRILSLLLMLSLAAVCLAQSPYPETRVGARPGAFSARSLGLGHTFLTDELGAAALAGNPATLAGQDTRWRFDLAADISRIRETRKYPFYDAFDGVLNYNNYALNDHLFSQLEGGVAWRTVVDPVESLVLAAGSYSVYRFDYLYHEEVRDRYSSGGVQDRKLGENRLDVEGNLRSISLGAAAKMHGPIALGFGLNLLTGDWNSTRAVYYMNPDSADRVERVSYTPRGTPIEMTAGMTVAASERLTFGVRALLPAGDFRFKRETGIEHGDTLSRSAGGILVTYPAHFAFGVRFQPRGEYRPLLYLEGENHRYSDFGPDFDDTFEIRAGAEQQVVPGAPVRVGFVYATAPTDEDRATTLFTAGIGFTLAKLHGDFGVELGRMNYLSRDLFAQSLYGDVDRTDLDRVETALFRGMITLRYTL